MRFTLCEDTGMLAVEGACPAHGGDACLAQFVEVPEPEDQEWIDALQEEAPGQMDEDQLMAYVRHVLVRASNETATGEDGPTFHEVRKAIECMDQLKALQLPDPGEDYMREEYDFALSVPGARPLTPENVRQAVARLKAREQFPEPQSLEGAVQGRPLAGEPLPPIRKLPEAEPRVECGPVQFGEDWPGLFIRGDSCAYLAMTLGEALRHMGPQSGIGPFSYNALEGLAHDLRGPLLGRGDPRR